MIITIINVLPSSLPSLSFASKKQECMQLQKMQRPYSGRISCDWTTICSTNECDIKLVTLTVKQSTLINWHKTKNYLETISNLHYLKTNWKVNQKRYLRIGLLPVLKKKDSKNPRLGLSWDFPITGPMWVSPPVLVEIGCKCCTPFDH